MTTAKSTRPKKRIGRWLLWGACVAVWTFALVTTYPVEIGDALLPQQVHFPAAKTLHVVSYAFLTVLAGWLRVRGSWRWLLLAFLALHGAATEFIQWMWLWPKRTGSIQDVLIDLGGIALGFALSWRWWFRPA